MNALSFRAIIIKANKLNVFLEGGLIMTKLNDDYILGLDIGTNSCGWAVTDKKNNLLKLRGKTALGSHLFEEGHSAADRRGFRTTRRRLKRRKWRLGLLEEIFAEEMAQVDPSFFVRLHKSWISPLDKMRTKYPAIVFPTAEEDSEFYKKYPTIYHLRHALMTEDKRFDLREIFLAIHHIVKYRGNFLQDTSINNFNASKIDVGPVLSNLNNSYRQLTDENLDSIQFKIENAGQIEAVIRGQDDERTLYKSDKVKKIAQLLVDSSDKAAKNVAKQVANAIMGYKTQFETILNKEIDKSDKGSWEFKLTDADADDKLESFLTELNEQEETIIAEIRKLFGAITLSNIVYEGMTLSESMVEKYNQHGNDYKLLKSVAKNHHDKQKAENLRLAYDLYVNYRHGRLLEAKTTLKKWHKGSGVLSKEEFYKVVQDNLDDSEASKQIIQEIEQDKFMPKQRINSNGVIPYQLHQIELDQIIAMQSKYYPFLAESNPVEEHLKQAPYKLDELVRFRVPYYVGPMITTDQQKETSGKNFAWMIRKSDDVITPWNFEQVVDTHQSARKFITRMTIKDTYLLGEDVLPANSLLYQKYEVLNELNNVKINKKRLDPQLKQAIYNDLFMQNKIVKVEELTNYLKQNQHLEYIEIKGLADPKKFNSSLSSYYQLKKMKLFDKQLDDPNYQADFEKIIELSSIFEDKKIRQAELHTIKWLTEEQIKALAKWRLKGWGRLSKKLLQELRDSNKKNIIELLWASENNFMQIVTQPDFKAAITKENAQVTEDNGIEAILADAYTSPANKKAIRQVIKVVDDVVKAADGKAPAQFAIEFTREPDKNPKLSQLRGSKLLKAYQDTAKEIVDKDLVNSLKNNMTARKLDQDKYFLYFMQGGRDAYTGKKINIDEITSRYEIDHILPQSFVKDDSLDNRVLTSKALNAAKSDDVPYKHFANKSIADLNMTVGEMWKKWQEDGLITKRKLGNLLLDPDHMNKYQRSGFINRQLVETSQIIKLVSVILQSKYPDSEIVVVKASYNSALRKRLQLYKSRAVNDYHHALDAYLSAICANFLYQVYPKLRPFFVYGKFKKFKESQKAQDTTIEQVKTFSFIWPLLQKDTKERKAPEEIRENNSNQIVFYKHPDIFDKLRKAYNYKYMLVSRETTSEDQAMFNMTIYPRAERDTAKTRSLIPKGEGLDTKIYGGYSGNTDAYMALVKITMTKDTIYRVVGVPMRGLADLKKAKKVGNYDEVLKQILEPLIMYDKKGKPKRGLESFTVLAGHLLNKQVVIDGDRKFALSSSAYMYNAKQLTLSQETMRIVSGHIEKTEDKDMLFISAYDEILAKVDKYLPLFEMNRFIEGLHQGREKFINLEINDKAKILKELLNGLHDNSQFGNLKAIGIKTPFGMMQIANGIILSSNAKLIFQSPTGLFEKRVKVTDL